MWNVIAIFIGGGLGSITRYGVSRMVTSGFQNINPLGTLVSNVISTSILGIVLFSVSNKFNMPSALHALLIIGFCGGFSTFSTFSYETFELLRTGSYGFAAANFLVSILLGIAVLFFISKSI